MSEAVSVFDFKVHEPTPQPLLPELLPFLQYAVAAGWPRDLAGARGYL